MTWLEVVWLDRDGEHTETFGMICYAEAFFSEKLAKQENGLQEISLHKVEVIRCSDRLAV